MFSSSSHISLCQSVGHHRVWPWPTASCAVARDGADLMGRTTGEERPRTGLVVGPFENGRRAAEPVRVLKISQELGEVAEALHGALGANPRKGASPGGRVEGARAELVELGLPVGQRRTLVTP